MIDFVDEVATNCFRVGCPAASSDWQRRAGTVAFCAVQLKKKEDLPSIGKSPASRVMLRFSVESHHCPGGGLGMLSRASLSALAHKPSRMTVCNLSVFFARGSQSGPAQKEMFVGMGKLYLTMPD